MEVPPPLEMCGDGGSVGFAGAPWCLGIPDPTISNRTDIISWYYYCDHDYYYHSCSLLSQLSRLSLLSLFALLALLLLLALLSILSLLTLHSLLSLLSLFLRLLLLLSLLSIPSPLSLVDRRQQQTTTSEKRRPMTEAGGIQSRPTGQLMRLAFAGYCLQTPASFHLKKNRMHTLPSGYMVGSRRSSRQASPSTTSADPLCQPLPFTTRVAQTEEREYPSFFKRGTRSGTLENRASCNR